MKKYSIILPVRNGGEYVKQCVNSILSQTLDNFNFLVLDNQSTDGTKEWIEALNDERITVYPSATPLSIEENWGRITGIRKNEFITLIGHDDVLHANYLETMDNLIAKFPDASLYQTSFTYIDSKNKKIRRAKPVDEIQTAPEFLIPVLLNRIDITGTGFMMRSADYDALDGIPTTYPNLLFADFELWLRLAIKSYKVTSPIEGFSFRLHQSTTSISSDIKYQAAFEKFIYFLAGLKKIDNAYRDIIEDNAFEFLVHYCQSLSHRVLRSPDAKREGLSVRAVLQKGQKYLTLLAPDKQCHKLSNFSIRMATVIDSSAPLRRLFRLAKKVYAIPILK